MGATASPAPRAGLCRFPPWGSPGHPPRCGLERRWDLLPRPSACPISAASTGRPALFGGKGGLQTRGHQGWVGCRQEGPVRHGSQAPGPPEGARGPARPLDVDSQEHRAPTPGDQRPPRPSSTGSEPAITFHVRFLSLGVIQEDRGTGTLITGVPEPSPCPRPWPAPSRNQRECLGATRSHAASLPAPLAAAARLRPSSQSEDAGQREGCHLPRGACARAGRSRREGRRGFRPCCPGFPLVASEGLRAD